MLKVTYEEREQWAQFVRKRRERKQWTQEQLARKAQVSVTAVQKIERGVAGGRSMYEHLKATLANGH